MAAPYYVAKRFVVARISGITGFAAKAPAGLHEDELPPNVEPTRICVIYQIETGRSILGTGAIYVGDVISVLIDVVVPGRSQLPGEGLYTDIINAMHTANGPVSGGGRIASCVFRGPIASLPEHTASGLDYEHLRQRYELQAMVS